MTRAEWNLINADLEQGRAAARQAYIVVNAMISARLQGKCNAERKPPCTVRMMLQGQVHCEFKPDLVLRGGQWAVNAIALNMKTQPRGTFRVLIQPDGGMRAKLWTRHLIGEFTPLALTILELVARGEAHFLAANKSSHCALCGRSLTDAGSREFGVGPECADGFYARFNAIEFETAETATRSEHELRERVKAIRLEMKAEHPDLGGGGDGALFARLSDELKSLRAALNKGRAKA